MSMKITIEIALEEAGTVSPAEAAVIAALQADVATTPAPAPVPAAAVVPKAAAPVAAPAPEKRGPGRPPKAEKPAPAPTSPQSTKAAVLDETIDEEEVPDDQAIAEAEVEAEDDLLGGEETTTFTKADAIAKATQLVSSQKQAVVKAALASVGAKRVSDLNDADAIQSFMAALEA